MLVYNVKNSDNYLKTSGSSWQCYRDEPDTTLLDSESFKSKIKLTGSTLADGYTNNVKIAVPLKYLSNFWRTLETPLINYAFFYKQ